RISKLLHDLEHLIREELDVLVFHLDGFLFVAGRLLLDQGVDAGPQRRGAAALLRVTAFLAQIVAILPEFPVRESAECRSRPNSLAISGRSWSEKASRSALKRP